MTDLLSMKTDLSQLTPSVKFMSNKYDKLIEKLDNNALELKEASNAVQLLKKNNFKNT